MQQLGVNDSDIRAESSPTSIMKRLDWSPSHVIILVGLRSIQVNDSNVLVGLESS